MYSDRRRPQRRGFASDDRCWPRSFVHCCQSVAEPSVEEERLSAEAPGTRRNVRVYGFPRKFLRPKFHAGVRAFTVTSVISNCEMCAMSERAVSGSVSNSNDFLARVMPRLHSALDRKKTGTNIASKRLCRSGNRTQPASVIRSIDLPPEAACRYCDRSIARLTNRIIL